jgi:3-hydroxybutyryl-CoA dehydratase
MTTAATLAFDDLALGREASFEARVSAADLDRFIALSGDASPLHADAAFASARGFGGRVVHGAYIGALVSRLVGMHLPGRDAIVHSMSLEFRSPLVVDETVRVAGIVDQVSDAVRSAVLRVTVTATADGRTVATGKVRLGFTEEKDPR